MFDLYVYHILVLVIVKHNGDEPPKKTLPLFVYNVMYDMFQPLVGLHHVNNSYTTLEITARCTFV